MKKQRRMSIVLFSIILLAYFLAYFIFNFFILRDALFSINWLSMLFLMLLYAVIPCIPAVILRIKFERYALKWIARTATILGVVCVIILSVEMLSDNELISTFAQYALTSSVPALYCVALFGLGREIWVALVPSLVHFLSFFLRQAIVYGFVVIVEFIRYLDLSFILLRNPDPFMLKTMMTVILMNTFFAMWGLLLIFISRIVYRFINRLKNKSKVNRRVKINK